MLLALLLIVADACPRVRRTHYLLPTTSNGFGNQYYAIEKATWLALATNRTLILPPVLDHAGPRAFAAWPGCGDAKRIGADAVLRALILKSDGDDLKKMVKLFEEGKLKVCVDEHFGFDKVPDALSKSLTARSGGKLVIDVASPAPSETCCVVA